jgi:hypothetical protein
VAVVHSIQGHHSNKPLSALVDTGSTYTHISASSLPKGVTPLRLPRPVRGSTLAGTIESYGYVQLKDITLPELDPSRRIESLRAYVFKSPCKYNVILGTDFCATAGLIIDCAEQEIRWLDDAIPFKATTHYASSTAALEDYTAATIDHFDAYTACQQILESKYEGANTEDVANQQTHLTPEQRADLAKLLSEFPQLFSGKLGLYPHRKVHLEVDPNAKPVYARPYSVAHNHQEMFRHEIDRLVEIGVLEPCGATDWAAPTFAVPKKDGGVRIVSDFRALNKVIHRRVYPLPRIQDILAKRSGYAFFTKLDIAMQFYTFELDDEAKDLCAIVTPFGKYRYC